MVDDRQFIHDMRLKPNGGRLPLDLEPEMPRDDEDTDSLGRLSAQAVLAQYEAAAKHVEDMGIAIKERIAALEASLQECDQDMKLLGDAAQVIRDKGKLAYAHIEHTSALSKEIRGLCTDFRQKMSP
jgi:hypothetical protein